MSLPVINSLADCTDLRTSVLPYIHQLYGLHQHVLHAISSRHALMELYISTNPLVSAFAFSLLLAPLFLLFSELNKNYSQVDRFWSILPTVYNAHFVIFAHMKGLPTQRLDTLLALSVLWSVRLPFIELGCDIYAERCRFG